MVKQVAAQGFDLVHPHGRGDNNFFGIASPVLGGSPPRAWGQSAQRRIDKIVLRFTPTGVGTIGLSPSRRRQKTVHPHGRGDNLVAAAKWVWRNLVHPHGRGDNT